MGLRCVAFQFLFRASMADSDVSVESTVDLVHQFSELRSMARRVSYFLVMYEEMYHLMYYDVFKHSLLKVVAITECQMIRLFTAPQH